MTSEDIAKGNYQINNIIINLITEGNKLNLE